MNATNPRATFRAETRSQASPRAVYAILADVGTTTKWGGEQAPSKRFRLLTMDAPARALSVGETFSSTGDNGNGTFHDRSVVVEAEPGSRFAFDTDSTLDRKHGKPLHARFTHRYTIEPDGEGSVLRYTGAVWPQNYVPYWLKAGFRTMTRIYVERLMTKHLRNLSAMALDAGRRPAEEAASA